MLDMAEMAGFEFNAKYIRFGEIPLSASSTLSLEGFSIVYAVRGKFAESR
jgi:hypothetical protein